MDGEVELLLGEGGREGSITRVGADDDRFGSRGSKRQQYRSLRTHHSHTDIPRGGDDGIASKVGPSAERVKVERQSAEEVYARLGVRQHAAIDARGFLAFVVGVVVEREQGLQRGAKVSELFQARLHVVTVRDSSPRG